MILTTIRCPAFRRNRKKTLVLQTCLREENMANPWDKSLFVVLCCASAVMFSYAFGCFSLSKWWINEAVPYWSQKDSDWFGLKIRCWGLKRLAQTPATLRDFHLLLGTNTKNLKFPQTTTVINRLTVQKRHFCAVKCGEHMRFLQFFILPWRSFGIESDCMEEQCDLKGHIYIYIT